MYNLETNDYGLLWADIVKTANIYAQYGRLELVAGRHFLILETGNCDCRERSISDMGQAHFRHVFNAVRGGKYGSFSMESIRSPAAYFLPVKWSNLFSIDTRTCWLLLLQQSLKCIWLLFKAGSYDRLRLFNASFRERSITKDCLHVPGGNKTAVKVFISVRLKISPFTNRWYVPFRQNATLLTILDYICCLFQK